MELKMKWIRQWVACVYGECQNVLPLCFHVLAENRMSMGSYPDRGSSASNASSVNTNSLFSKVTLSRCCGSSGGVSAGKKEGFALGKKCIF
jgi:hypothetical protein